MDFGGNSVSLPLATQRICGSRSALEDRIELRISVLRTERFVVWKAAVSGLLPLPFRFFMNQLVVVSL